MEKIVDNNGVEISEAELKNMSDLEVLERFL